jgi:hypothetical protein
MPDAKITQLPAATLPLAGTEKAEIVQGGVNKQVDVSEFGGSSGGTVTSVTGTTNRITSTGGATPVINIDAAYDAAQLALINAKVADAINDGTTTVAPSQNAVFDALALKQPYPIRNDVTLANGVATIDWSAGDIQNLTITEAKVITAISNPVVGQTILLIIPGTNSLTFSGLTAVIEGTYLTGVTNRIYIQCIKVAGGAEYRITYDNGVSPYPFSVITSTSNVTAWAITTNEWFSKRTLTLTENSTFSLTGAANGYQGECWVEASGAQRTVSIPAGAGHIMIGVGDGAAKNIIIESGERAVVFWSFNGTIYLWGYNLE